MKYFGDMKFNITDRYNDQHQILPIDLFGGGNDICVSKGTVTRGFLCRELTIKIEEWSIVEGEKYFDINEGQDILTLSCKDRRGTSVKVSFEKEENIKFDVVMSTGAIKDCSNRGIASFDVKYIVSVNGEKRNGTIKCRLSPVECGEPPVLRLKAENVEYNSEETTVFLKVKHPRTINYAPTLSLRPTAVRIIREDNNEVGNARMDCREARPDPDCPNHGYTPDMGVGMIPVDQQNRERQDDVIYDIYPKGGYWVEVPMILDLRTIDNPTRNEEKWNLEVDYEWWKDSDQQHASKGRNVIPFKLERNNAKYELRVEVMNHVLDGEYVMPDFIDIANWGNDEIYNYTISIRNAAKVVQEGHEGIKIRNLNSELSTVDGVSLMNNDRIVALGNYITISTEGIDEGGAAILNPRDSIDINAYIGNGNMINRLVAGENTVYSTQIRNNITFEYTIDGEEWQHYEGCVLIELGSEPRQEWLGVDFGTSAVVALYGNTYNLENARINQLADYVRDLSNRKEKILKAAYPKDQERDFAKVDDEKIFINSNIVLNSNGKISDGYFFRENNGIYETNYKESIVFFSPGTKFDYNNLLPSLKSMMGHRTVPGRGDMEVDTVFQATYRMLFDLYLSSLAGNNRIEKIVLTYPNTFSAGHIEKIRQIAKRCIPTLRDRYIITISESDAVSFDYLVQREELLKDVRDVNVRNVIDRHILIYDMGAGTLDLTYFTNRVKEGRGEIDIVGRYGINKAGNYLDYVLAEIVVDLVGGDHPIGGVRFEDYIQLDENNQPDIEAPFNLKKYVKNHLKPLMAKYGSVDEVPNDVMMPQWDIMQGKLESIKLKEVFEHIKFKEYIKDVSEKVICNMRESIKNMPVDVVVFSGRMSLFESIRKAVMQGFEKDYAREICISRDLDGQSLKSSVVKGALKYAETNYDFVGDFTIKQRPFYCTFCAIVAYFRGNRMSYKVRCMLTNTTPGFRIGESINLAGAMAIYLVQTYASTKESIISDFENGRDVTTILSYHRVRMLEQGVRDVSIEANVTNNNNGICGVSMRIGGGIVINDIPRENLTSDSFRKSSWPVRFPVSQ